MKKIQYLACFILFLIVAGCVRDPYSDFEVEVLNLPSGVAAGVVDSCVVMKRDDQRQVISISHLADGIRLMNCKDAPYIYVKMNFLGNSGPSILKIELPQKTERLNRYFYRKVDTTKAVFNGKSVDIIDLVGVSSDGRTLEILYRVSGMFERRKGFLDVETMQIREP